MGVQWILAAHGFVTLLAVVSLLCGHWPIFQGTFIERINYFITVGAYDYFLRVVTFIFGSRGRNAVQSVQQFCCERPNPILQVIYFAILGLTYFFIAKSSFKYIPSYYVGDYHRSTSMLAVGIGILLFLLTCFSDPGTVTKNNVAQYISAYPYDNIIFTEKECSTCKIPKPARSKHCSICGRCVARFDHHCGWMNTCIGERNTRFFMAFLFWHFFLCLYGVAILGFILAGQLKERKIIHILTGFYGLNNSFTSLAPHVIQWLVSLYNTQILLMVFLSVVCLLLAGFFGYHAHLCVTNTTTNETFKWEDYLSWKRKLNEAKASAAALKANMLAMNEGKTPESKWRALFRRSPLHNEEAVVKCNMYDRGVLRNLLEIMFPLSGRSSFQCRKSD